MTGAARHVDQPTPRAHAERLFLGTLHALHAAAPSVRDALNRLEDLERADGVRHVSEPTTTPHNTHSAEPATRSAGTWAFSPEARHGV